MSMLEQELSRYWKTVVDTIQDGVMIVDPQGLFVSVNRAFEKITGYSREGILGLPCSVLKCNICKKARDKKGRMFCSVFEFGSLNRRRCAIQRKDGSYVPVLKNASLLYDVGNQVIGAVETLTDLTEIVEKDSQIEAFRRELREEDSFHGILGHSSPLQQALNMITNAAPSDAPVIILGESGTGKELAAKALHEIGPRKRKPFVKVNSAALTETLLESELFGHVRGAYTGAYEGRKGRFEAAHGGDIFFDEIGDLPLSTQVKMLRVLEEKVIERVGENRPVPVDVRIISATNKNLKQLVASGGFREDLFFRINVIPIVLPPLRDRVEDIPLLAEFFFKRIQLKTGKPIQGISPETMEALISYDWPGNVRELKSAFEYALVTCQEALIQPQHLPLGIFQGKRLNHSTPNPPFDRKEMKKKALRNALERSGGNQSEAARILGVSRVTVWNRVRAFGIDIKNIAKESD
jgi:two-component system, NtrC family, response regulator HydG